MHNAAVYACPPKSDQARQADESSEARKRHKSKSASVVCNPYYQILVGWMGDIGLGGMLIGACFVSKPDLHLSHFELHLVRFQPKRVA